MRSRTAHNSLVSTFLRASIVSARTASRTRLCVKSRCQRAFESSKRARFLTAHSLFAQSSRKASKKSVRAVSQARTCAKLSFLRVFARLTCRPSTTVHNLSASISPRASKKLAKNASRILPSSVLSSRIVCIKSATAHFRTTAKSQNSELILSKQEQKQQCAQQCEMDTFYAIAHKNAYNAQIAINYVKGHEMRILCTNVYINYTNCKIRLNAVKYSITQLYTRRNVRALSNKGIRLHIKIRCTGKYA